MKDQEFTKWLLTVKVGSQTTKFEKDCRHSLDAQLECYQGIDEVQTTVEGIK